MQKTDAPYKKFGEFQFKLSNCYILFVGMIHVYMRMIRFNPDDLLYQLHKTVTIKRRRLTPNFFMLFKLQHSLNFGPFTCFIFTKLMQL